MSKKESMEILFILDCSGSMTPFIDDTIGGFNRVLREQREKGRDVTFSTVLFNSDSRKLYWRIPLEEIEDLTEDDYCTRGSTALFDAVTMTLTDMANTQKAKAPETWAENRICFITTDGKENASRNCKKQDMKDMIRFMEEQLGWNFFYLSSDPDGMEDGREFGFRPERIAVHEQSEEMHFKKFAAMNRAVDQIIYKAEDTDESWKADLDGKNNE